MTSGQDSAQKFGGPWTIIKVETVVAYLQAFTTLLFNKPSPSRPFKRVYIDGFAGSGSFKFGAITTGFFKRDAMEIAGSAQRALRVNPPFDELHFIEKRSACLNALREMVADDPRVTIHEGDANDAIRKLCEEINWRSTRGVIFLDPFGAELDCGDPEGHRGNPGVRRLVSVPAQLGFQKCPACSRQTHGGKARIDHQNPRQFGVASRVLQRTESLDGFVRLWDAKCQKDR